MWKWIKMLRQSLCNEMTLLQTGFNSNSAGNAFPAAAGPCRGLWREGFSSCLGSLETTDEVRAEEEAGSVTMREQWLFSNEIVPVNSESSFLSICVQDSWWKREHSPHTLMLVYHRVSSVAPSTLCRQMCSQRLLKDHLLFWLNLAISPIDS